jgi:hypothetical protein
MDPRLLSLLRVTAVSQVTPRLLRDWQDAIRADVAEQTHDAPEPAPAEEDD